CRHPGTLGQPAQRRTPHHPAPPPTRPARHRRPARKPRRHHPLADRRAVSPHGRPPPRRPARLAPTAGRRRCPGAAACATCPKRTPHLPPDQRLRPHRKHHLHHLLPPLPRGTLGPDRTHWPPH